MEGAGGGLLTSNTSVTSNLFNRNLLSATVAINQTKPISSKPLL